MISPSLSSFPPIVESQDSQVAEKSYFYHFPVDLEISGASEINSPSFLYISIYFYIFLYISIRFHRSCRKNWSIRFGQCILPSPGIKMASFPRQSLGRACALVWWFRGFPGHQKT
jgi:hypothetical protein